MSEKIDILSWNRRELYENFIDFEEPFHGVMVNMDMTNSMRNSKSLDWPFTATYLHKFIVAINQCDPFCYRIENTEVYRRKVVNLGTTIMRDNGVFAYVDIDYSENIEEFVNNYLSAKKLINNRTSIYTNRTFDNLIHTSILPWIAFTGLSHARKFSRADSIPKVTFGKISSESGKYYMPISIHVHHGLVDGKDVGDFIYCFQNLLDK